MRPTSLRTLVLLTSPLDQPGMVVAAKNGTATITIQAGQQSIKLPVAVKDYEKPRPVSFRNELIGALNVGGCNSGACHGTPSGKNGFKLSLRGYDPPADHIQLTRDVLGRRSDSLDPEAALVYQKALGRIPHEGGQRYQASSIPARVMRGWFAEGLKDDPAGAPTLKST